MKKTVSILLGEFQFFRNLHPFPVSGNFQVTSFFLLQLVTTIGQGYEVGSKIFAPVIIDNG